MDRFGRRIVALRIPILIAALVLLVPSVIGYAKTRVNYDILSYLPGDIETMAGQDILTEEFGTGAFSMFVAEGMTPKEITEAERVVSAVRENAEKGIGVFMLNGKMLDIAFVEGAQRTIALAKASGVYKGEL